MQNGTFQVCFTLKQALELYRFAKSVPINTDSEQTFIESFALHVIYYTWLLFVPATVFYNSTFYQAKVSPLLYAVNVRWRE